MRSKFIFSLLCTLFIFQGCVDDKYDLSEISGEITLFQDSIMMPLGHSAGTGSNMGNLFFKGIEAITVREDGVYFAVYYPEESIFPMPSVEELMLNFDDGVELKSSLGLTSQEVATNIEIPFNQSGEFTGSIYGDILTRLDSAFFDTGYNLSVVNIDVTFDGLSINNGETPTADINIVFPESFGFKNLPDNKFSTTINLTENGKTYNNRINLSKVGAPDASNKYAISSTTTLKINAGTQISVSSDASVSIKISFNDLQLAVVYGKFDINDRQNTTMIEVKDFYNYLDEDDESSFAFAEPYLVMETVTNTGFPLDIDLTFRPRKINKTLSLMATSKVPILPVKSPILSPLNENESKFGFGPKVQENWLDMTRKSLAEISDHLKIRPKDSLWIKMVGTPLNDMLKAMPDSMRIESVGNVADSDEPTFLTRETRLDMNYRFIIPFILDNGFKIAMKDTLRDIFDKDTRKMLFTGNPEAKDSVVLYGTVESGIPLKFDLKISPLNDDDQKVGIVFPSTIIHPGNINGDNQKTISDFAYVIGPDDYDKMRNVAHFEATYIATNEEISNMRITDRDKLYMTLKVKKWGGITFGGE